ncbi:carboxymuconolactone decarboxylase family protein [Kitasatospora purpeofusca]|uniref:carboxymuconolactone decarboxylase family protein n=1 Tax=Kitasatospora purpeofusca TaxID=67352 RepID=UPI003253E65F
MSTPPTTDDRLARGLAEMARITGGHTPHLDAVDGIAPDLARYAVEFAFGDIYARGGLTTPERQLITLGVLAALGDAEPQLAAHVRAAFTVGLTVEQVVEAVMHIVPFAGFPRALNAMTVVERVVAEQRDTMPRPGGERATI